MGTIRLGTVPLRLIRLATLVLAIGIVPSWPALAATLQPVSSAHVGIAMRGADGICLSVGAAGLRPGQPVALVVADPPQRRLAAWIVGRGPGCHGHPASVPDGYRLRLTTGSLPRGLVTFAVLAPYRVALRGHVARMRIPGAATTLRFRSCTSVDGVHLTLWAGKPLSGSRLWHAYVYLGQDLVPDCAAGDIGE